MPPRPSRLGAIRQRRRLPQDPGHAPPIAGGAARQVQDHQVVVGEEDGRAGRVLREQFERPVAIVGAARLQDAFVLARPGSGHPGVQADQSHVPDRVPGEDLPGVGQEGQRPYVDGLNEPAADLNELHAGQQGPLVVVDRLHPAAETTDVTNALGMEVAAVPGPPRPPEHVSRHPAHPPNQVGSYGLPVLVQPIGVDKAGSRVVWRSVDGVDEGGGVGHSRVVAVWLPVPANPALNALVSATANSIAGPDQ